MKRLLLTAPPTDKPTRSPAHSWLLAALLPLLLIIGSAGCGVPPEDEGDGVDQVNPPDESEEDVAKISAAATAPDPGTVFIKSVRAIGGSGCPQGTASASLSADQQSLNVSFSKFSASMGPGISLTKARVFCSIALGINVPQGFTFAISKVTNRGFVNIPGGVSAKITSEFHMQGNADEAAKTTTITGAAKKEFLISNTFDIGTINFSQCGVIRDAIVDTKLQLSGSRSKESTISIDRLDKSFTQLYRMVWRRCP
jgi:hypothetical protein